MNVNEACERSIILAADNVHKLRQPDVIRVMEDFMFTYGSVGEIADYITEHRPDLAKECQACKNEINQGRLKPQWKCSNCGNTEDKEREIMCWKCGKGEMLYTPIIR